MARRLGYLIRPSHISLERLKGAVGGKGGYAEVAILLIALALAFMVRALPARWGLLLSEFDPWWHFKAASFIIERGWGGFLEYAGWVDEKSWYPTGLPVGRALFPGVSFTMAFIYLSLSSLGIEVDAMELAAVLPVIYGVLAVFATFLLARYILGTRAALAASLFMSISSAHISRTTIGWFDDESLSIPLMLGGYVAYLAATNEGRSYKGAASLGLLAGLLLGYVVATWGAHKFPITFIPLYTAVITFLGRYHPKILAAYIPTVAAYTLIAINVPKLGVAYLREVTMLSGFFVLGYLILTEASRRLLSREGALLVTRGSAIIALASALTLAALGAAGVPGLKFFSVLAPWLRGSLPIVISVAENQTSTWSAMFQDFGPLLILVPYGTYLLIKKGTNGAIFLLLFSLFTIYFSSSIVRLGILAAPAVAMVAGYTFSSMLEAAGRAFAHQRTKTAGPIPKIMIAIPLQILLLLSFLYLPAEVGGGLGLSPIDSGYSPATIVSSSMPVRGPIPDWLRAVEWMRNNLPASAVIASWWDYGNWISIVANKTSVIDNTTIDSKRIAKVGYAFMSPEDVSYRIFKEMGVTHVLIFVTHRPQLGPQSPPSLLGFGDEAKWVWMLRIANQEADVLGVERLDEEGLLGPLGDPLNPTERFWNSTTLGALIPFKPQQMDGQVAHVYQEPSLRNYRLVYSSSEPYTSLAYVYIYELVP